jgi:DNA-binding NtrC family response regulator
MRLLLVEDKDSFRRLLVQALGGSNWDVLAVADPKEALDALERGLFDVLVTDLRLPGMNGLDLLKRAKRLHPGLRIVLMSAFGEPKDIVEAIHSGADDFLPKPFDLDHFLAVLGHLAALAEAPAPDPREPWVVHSPLSRELDLALQKAADSDAPALFLGERGSGRHRSARRLHALGRPQAPFKTLAAANLGAEGIEERLLDLLHGGTLFLSELDELPFSGLAGLLKSLDIGSARGIRWMGAARSFGQLPEPLRLRLGVLCFEVAPLRERREDILSLFRHFLASAAQREGRTAPLVERHAERDLLQRQWPGNIPQLRLVAHRALQATQGPLLALVPEGPESEATLALPWPEPGTLETMLASVEASVEALLLQRSLESSGQDTAKAAASLGLTVRALAQRLKEHGIPLAE